MYQSPENDENKIHNRFLSYIARIEKEYPGIFKTPMGKLKMYDDVTNMVTSGIISRQEAEIWLNWAQEIFFKLKIDEDNKSENKKVESKSTYVDDSIVVNQSKYPSFDCILRNIKSCDESVLLDKAKLVKREIEYYKDNEYLYERLKTIGMRINEEIKRRFRV